MNDLPVPGNHGHEAGVPAFVDGTLGELADLLQSCVGETDCFGFGSR
jgi:hypothetical protein